MVIKYTAEELTAIGELVTLKECISREQGQAGRQEAEDMVVSSSGDSYPTVDQKPQFDQQQDLHIIPKLFYTPEEIRNLSAPINNNSNSYCCHHPYYQHQTQSKEPLAQSVAEFFRKAQKNFYLSLTPIDPFKVRTLSEVEADLIGGQGPY